MKIVINSRYSHLTEFIKSLPRQFDKEGETLYQGRNQVKAFRFGENELVVKRYKRPHIIQQIAYRWFKPSKAKRAYLFALRLAKMNISTPEAIAYIEKSAYGLFKDSYFISTRCYDTPLFPVLVETAEYDKVLAATLAEYLVELHLKGFLHGDLNLANILYKKDETGYRFTVIDINRSSFNEAPSQEACLKNLMRVTHRVELLRHIVTVYALKRQWNADYCCNHVENLLHEFEQKREKKYLWKKRIKRLSCTR